MYTNVNPTQHRSLSSKPLRVCTLNSSSRHRLSAHSYLEYLHLILHDRARNDAARAIIATLEAARLDRSRFRDRRRGRGDGAFCGSRHTGCRMYVVRWRRSGVQAGAMWCPMRCCGAAARVRLREIDDVRCGDLRGVGCCFKPRGLRLHLRSVIRLIVERRSDW
ncbi:hypothetical protein K458DRAFT_89099 [Lentithecium fluviatile CBS 122367]|uniref:Uncharacterized protein n=1 Tax=Lentithecium fluviatile CBS 122367 TaxID=1168545 RepID=A0A6G1ISF7_9PLEO|nr:hypothetical protein K458DRAFT_89099 [Lentithecium fluviatile CBS 122367]